MAIQSYRDLEVYQLSFQLAVEVDQVSKSLPNDTLGKKLNRFLQSVIGSHREPYR